MSEHHASLQPSLRSLSAVCAVPGASAALASPAQLSRGLLGFYGFFGPLFFCLLGGSGTLSALIMTFYSHLQSPTGIQIP